MTAFDEAWGVAKMPIVRDSITYHGIAGDKPSKPHRYTADFFDPVEERYYPMSAAFYGGASDAKSRPPFGLGMREYPEAHAEISDTPVHVSEDPLTHAEIHPQELIEWEQDEDSEPLYPKRTSQAVLDYEGGTDWMGHIQASPQRRGRGTALYDLLAMILEHRAPGHRIVPNSGQSEDATAFWNNRYNWIPDDGEDYGSIRDES